MVQGCKTSGYSNIQMFESLIRYIISKLRYIPRWFETSGDFKSIGMYLYPICTWALPLGNNLNLEIFHIWINGQRFSNRVRLIAKLSAANVSAHVDTTGLHKYKACTCGVRTRILTACLPMPTYM